MTMSLNPQTPAPFDLSRIALFTDIHYGVRNNSPQHLQDCSDFITWFIEIIRENKCTAIAFLGDWFENRNTINVATNHAAFRDAQRLNELGIPVFFILGNHDLHLRNSRDVYSTAPYESLSNFVLIDEPLSIGTTLFCPFLFHHEYEDNRELINNHEYVLGHFEFKNFTVTGLNQKLEKGPDQDLFSAPNRILSGHFHKRQQNKNVTYIGNPFSTNFGDVNDKDRGCAILDTTKNTDNLHFYNWPMAPRFIKTTLSYILANEKDPFDIFEDYHEKGTLSSGALNPRPGTITSIAEQTKLILPSEPQDTSLNLDLASTTDLLEIENNLKDLKKDIRDDKEYAIDKPEDRERNKIGISDIERIQIEDKSMYSSDRHHLSSGEMTEIKQGPQDDYMGTEFHDVECEILGSTTQTQPPPATCRPAGLLPLRVQVLSDTLLSPLSLLLLRDTLLAQYDLREFTLVDDRTALNDSLTTDLSSPDVVADSAELADIVVNLLTTSLQPSKTIDGEYLLSLFKELVLEHTIS